MAIENNKPVNAAYTNSKLMSRTQNTSAAGEVAFTNPTESTDKDTGAVVVEGGVGIEKNLNVGGDILGNNLSGTNTGDLTLAPIGNTGSPEAAILTGQVLEIQEATAVSPGVVSIGTQSLAGDKTFTDDVTINGDLTVLGNTTTLSTADLEVEDQNITVNKGGDDASSEGAGITVERTGTDGSIAYENALASKFKVGDLGAESEIITAAFAQILTGLKTFTSGIVDQGTFSGDIAIDSTTSGADQVVTSPSKMIIKFTNAGLTSIAGFSAAADSRIFFAINGTGADLTIKNQNAISTDIQTGTGQDFVFKSGSICLLVRDTNSSRWRLVGGGGSGATAYQETPTGTVDGVNDTFGPLAQTAIGPDNIIVTVDGLIIPKDGWQLISNSIEFQSGYIPATGQNVYVYYSGATGAAQTYTPKTEFRSVTNPEIIAGKLVLGFTPVLPATVLVDLIGGTSQHYNVDYTITGNELIWSGYTLAGFLTVGDVLRVHYHT
jgi:hypothetical protein